MINVGERIKYIRETYDTTQEELGKILHISKSSVCHYESNDRDIPLRNLSLMADYYGLSIDYILGLTYIKKYQDLKKEIDRNKTGQRIKAICTEQKLTNVALAKELNTTESCIRKYKTGETLILTAFALQLHQKFDYSIDWIVGKTETKTIKEKQKVFN